MAIIDNHIIESKKTQMDAAAPITLHKEENGFYLQGRDKCAASCTSTCGGVSCVSCTPVIAPTPSLNMANANPEILNSQIL